MKSIFKYKIMSMGRLATVEGPIIKLLSAQVQHGSIVVWAEVDSDAPVRKFDVLPIGTGWDVSEFTKDFFDVCTFLDTVQLDNGNLVFHIYYREIVEEPVKKPAIPVAPKEERQKEKIAMKNQGKIDYSLLSYFVK